MDRSTIRTLIELDNSFYREQGASFKRSRQRGWAGWSRVCAHLASLGTSLSILDMACGNMRFERYASEAMPHADLSFTCIDSCPAMNEGYPQADFIECDVLEEILEGRDLRSTGTCFDAAVSFGFMHHVPSVALREAFVGALSSAVRPGGILALSFWRFMDDVRLAERARRTTAEFQGCFEVDLDEGDYIIGWDGVAGAYRYCHHFTPEEIDVLAASVRGTCTVVDRFDADGRNGALNGYVILRRCPSQ